MPSTVASRQFRRQRLRAVRWNAHDREILRLAVPAFGALVAEPLFLLADSAFAFACNSRNERAVAAQSDISFIRPARLGDRLVATAREISRTGRSGIYDVSVTLDATAIAELRGHSRTVGGKWVAMAGAADKS